MSILLTKGWECLKTAVAQRKSGQMRRGPTFLICPVKIKPSPLCWSECRPLHQRVSGSIPDQGMYLGCSSIPAILPLIWVPKGGNRPCFFLTLIFFLSTHPPTPGKDRWNMSSGRRLKKYFKKTGRGECK